MKKLLIACLALSLFQVANAKEPKYTKGFSECIDNSGGVTVEIVDCNHTETEIQDARLNLYYQELMAKLSPAEKNKLRNEQRAWIKLKNKRTEAAANQPGTMAQIESSSVYLEMTAKKADELEQRLRALR